jgi:hypothetical protein
VGLRRADRTLQKGYGNVGMQLRAGDFGILVTALSVAVDLKKIAVTVLGQVATWALTLFFFSIGSQAGAGGAAVGGLIALIILWVGLSLTFGTVNKMCIDELASGIKVTWRSALQYATSNLTGFLFGPLVFGVLLLLLGAVEVIVLFIGRIPFVGELIISLAFLPLLLVNVLAAVTLLFGGWLLFPVIAAEGASPLAAPLRVFELVRREPVRIVIQTCVALFMSLVATVILSILLWFSFSVTLLLSGIGLGPEKTAQIVGLGSLFGPFGLTGSSAFGLVQQLPFTIGIARFLLAIGFSAFIGVLWAVPTVFLIASGCAVYLASVRDEQAIPVVEAVPPQVGPLVDPA